VTGVFAARCGVCYGAPLVSSGPKQPTPATTVTGFDLLPGGAKAFERILRRIDEARHSIHLRAFDWRDDETGQIVGGALLRAADRGVQVTILKDRVGMHYEYLEDSKQSFFHKEIALRARLQTWFLMAVYWRWGSLRQKASPVAAALLSHPNVSVSADRKRFDHAKLYIFDGETVILGGMGIGDDFRYQNVDFMVEVSGPEAAGRLADRYEGRAPFDPRRRFDYLLHSFRSNGLESPSLAEQRLALIAGARRRITMAMAYLGDRACTDALADAVNRGVTLTLLTSARANVTGDLNLQTCNQLFARTRNAGHLRVVLHPRMVHGKAIVIDGAVTDIGSANFTPLSHGGYEEVNLYSRDPELARSVEEAIERDIQEGQLARPPVAYRRIYAVVERAISAYQARRRPPSARQGLPLLAGVPGVLEQGAQGLDPARQRGGDGEAEAGHAGRAREGNGEKPYLHPEAGRPGKVGDAHVRHEVVERAPRGIARQKDDDRDRRRVSGPERR
jgi:cardiolipin synthase